MNGADYITERLVQHGITTVFGYPGSAMLKIMDTMVTSGKIKYIQNFHEQACSFAADGYARANQKLGVLLVTSGPGGINALAGIADAYYDSVPMLVITGQDYTNNVLRKNGSRQNGFQDLDIVSIAKTITKYSVLVESVQELPEKLEEAIQMAESGRKGPVLIDVPIDVQFAELTSPAVCKSQHKDESPVISEQDVSVCADRIKMSKRPLILAGGGICGAPELLDKFSRHLNIPVVCTLNGLGSGVEAYGFSGLHGHTYANLAVYNADCLIVLGARLGQKQVGKKPEAYTKAKVIHVDIDAAELQREIKDELPIQGDWKAFIKEMGAALADWKSADAFAEWNNTLAEWKKKLETRDEVNQNGDGIDPVKLVREFSERIPKDAVVTADVGQNQMWVAQGMKSERGIRLLNSSGYGSMGFSLPAAIGASCRGGEVPTYAFMGDGGLQMNIQEFEYLKLKNPNVKCIVLNNNTLGMMREVQKRYYNNHFYGSNLEDYQSANLQKLADAYQLPYVRINTYEELDAFWAVLEKKGAYLIDIRIDFDSQLMNLYDENEVFQENCL